MVQRERMMARTQASYFCDANEHPSYFSFRQPEHFFQIAHSLAFQSPGAFVPQEEAHVSFCLSLCLLEIEAVLLEDTRNREKF